MHLLSWWRGLRRFGEETGGSAGREDVAGLLFLNVPQADVQLMLGRPVDWQPRPNRALLHDRHADRTVTVVPFLAARRVTSSDGPASTGDAAMTEPAGRGTRSAGWAARRDPRRQPGPWADYLAAAQRLDAVRRAASAAAGEQQAAVDGRAGRS